MGTSWHNSTLKSTKQLRNKMPRRKKMEINKKLHNKNAIYGKIVHGVLL
jgi:hypothetical protein